MALIGPEGAINELPPGLRRVAYGALIAGALVAGYYTLIQGPIADAKGATANNGHRIEKVESDISSIRGDVADIKINSAARDQKIDDINANVEAMNTKLDRLLGRGQKMSPYP